MFSGEDIITFFVCMILYISKQVPTDLTEKVVKNWVGPCGFGRLDRTHTLTLTISSPKNDLNVMI